MGTKYLTSDSTATGDTTKTIIDTLTIPMGVKRISGVMVSLGGAGLTTLESTSGILTLESDSDINLKPCVIPLPIMMALTSGVCAYEPRIYPVDVAVNGGEKIEGYVTMDMTQTINPTARFTLILET